ncbi:MAG: PTS sugar transporter subunit IIC [Elusimicrobia bacterium]|nr:PTS sugar transporter subunit IIC [Elusimicrobiota bacterium]
MSDPVNLALSGLSSLGWLGWWGIFAASLLSLDTVGCGQFMLGRPIVMGPALGMILGHPIPLAVFGAIFELLSLSDLPVGGHVPFNAGIATAAAGLLVASGISFELCFPLGAAFGWLHQKVEIQLRAGRGRLGSIVERRLERGADCGLGPLSLRELLKYAAASLALLCLTAFLSMVIYHYIDAMIPEALRRGLEQGLRLSLPLALASLLTSFKSVYGL